MFCTPLHGVPTVGFTVTLWEVAQFALFSGGVTNVSGRTGRLSILAPRPWPEVQIARFLSYLTSILHVYG